MIVASDILLYENQYPELVRTFLALTDPPLPATDSKTSAPASASATAATATATTATAITTHAAVSAAAAAAATASTAAPAPASATAAQSTTASAAPLPANGAAGATTNAASAPTPDSTDCHKKPESAAPKASGKKPSKSKHSAKPNQYNYNQSPAPVVVLPAGLVRAPHVCWMSWLRRSKKYSQEQVFFDLLTATGSRPTPLTLACARAG